MTKKGSSHMERWLSRGKLLFINCNLNAGNHEVLKSFGQ